MKKAIAFLFLLFPLLSIAQNTYQKGYFIENGIKTECLIKNLAWKNNPESIEYKLNETDEAQTKTIADISEFSVDNNSYKYKKYTVDIDLSSTVLNRLSTKKDPEWKKETLFLKVLVEGKATLYQYERGTLVRYFFSIDNHDKVEQLVYKEYSNANKVAENNAYRQQLFNLMKDGNIKQSKFENIKYKKNDLVALFVDYNKATGGQETTNISTKQNKGSINIKITPGVNFSSLNVENPVNESSFDFGSKTTFRLGAEVEYIMPFNNNKWSFFIDPNYQYYSGEGKKRDEIDDYNYAIKADYKFIALPIGVRHYMYLNNKSKIFIDAAYVLKFKLNDPYIQYDRSKLDIDGKSNLALGLGYSFDKFSIEARYNFKHNILNYSYWVADYNSMSIILGYKIF